VVKNKDGQIKLKQAVNLTAAGAASGSFWGLLIGMLFLSPLLGAVLGAAGGALGGALSDIGVDDNFMRELGETLQPSTSALFVLVQKVTPDKVLDEVAPYGGKVLRTSLTKTDEANYRKFSTKEVLNPKPFRIWVHKSQKKGIYFPFYFLTRMGLA